jgi:5,10-methylene-tetrahydrofolate dehydrogenase/methenyl tetrahydrofolate cyclohydrolase
VTVAYADAVGLPSPSHPGPGGVGPMTVAMLMADTVNVAHRALQKKPLTH